MSRFYVFLLCLCIGFFSFAEDDPPVLDVPESSTDASVDIQVASPSIEEEKLPADPTQTEALLDDNTPPTSVEDAEPVPEEGAVQTAEGEEVEFVQEEESEEVKSLRLKIRAYTPDYKYTFEGKKDPFSKPGALKDIKTLPEDRLHPVEQDSIDNIRLRAIIWGRDGVIPRALFETKNKTYTLTENDRIGQEGALIARIETDRVWTMKPVTDPATGLVKFEPYEKTLNAPRKGAVKGTELFYER